MSEAVDIVTDHWFNALGFPVLRAPRDITNLASRRISEKSGMRIVVREEIDYVEGRFPADALGNYGRGMERPAVHKTR